LGEKSSALYGIVSKRKGILLRVAIQNDIAQLLGDDPSRELVEVFLLP
jgi:hypothetical protein